MTGSHSKFVVSTIVGIIGITPLAITGVSKNSQDVGTGQIAGIVVAGGESSLPIARAIVTLVDRGGARDRQALTDEKGHFSFGRLTAGRFSLTAAKAAYITTTYGAMRPGGVGTDVRLENQQTLDGLRITLFKGGVISGRIADTGGRGLPGVEVDLARVRWTEGGRRLTLLGHPVTTNADGYYRVSGLLSGSYLVRAGSELDIPLRRLNASDIDSLLGLGRSTVMDAPEDIVKLSPIFAPGTADPGTARIVEVAAAADIQSVDVTMVPVRSEVVSGVVRASDGGALPPVNLILDRGFDQAQTMRLAGGSPSASFRFGAVPPGRYRLTASSGRGEATGTLYWSSTEFAVDGSGRRDISLTLRKGGEVTGILVPDKGGSVPVSGWAVVLIPVDPGVEPAVTSGPAALRADGSFRLSASPGRYWMTAATQAAPDEHGRAWTIKSAVVNGIDRVHNPIELRPDESVGGVEVTVTSEPTQVTGALRTADGQIAMQHYVIAFPARQDRRMWWPNSVRAVRPSVDGRYRISGLSPTAYYLAVVGDMEPGDWLAPGFLEKLVASATRIELLPGGTITRDLVTSK